MNAIPVMSNNTSSIIIMSSSVNSNAALFNALFNQYDSHNGISGSEIIIGLFIAGILSYIAHLAIDKWA